MMMYIQILQDIQPTFEVAYVHKWMIYIQFRINLWQGFQWLMILQSGVSNFQTDSTRIDLNASKENQEKSIYSSW